MVEVVIVLIICFLSIVNWFESFICFSHTLCSHPQCFNPAELICSYLHAFRPLLSDNGRSLK